MMFVEAEISGDHETAGDRARPPRPARRRVYISLLVTLSVLLGTVATVYWVFPNRQGEILAVVMQAHWDAAQPDLQSPKGSEIRAWSLGVFGELPNWPEATDGLVPTSASLIKQLGRELTITRYDLHGEAISLAFGRIREPSPRIHRRREDGLYAVSWHHGRFSCIAVGPVDSKEIWTQRVGAP